MLAYLLRERLGIDRQTLERWRTWWLVINEIGESRIRAAQRLVDELLVIHKDDPGACPVAWHRLPTCCPGGNQPPHLRLHRLDHGRLGQESSRRLWVRPVLFSQGVDPLSPCRDQ